MKINQKNLYTKLVISIILLGVIFMQSGCTGQRMYSQNRSYTYIDPVCGTKVEPDTELKQEYDGRTYYFSSPECLEVFKQNPGRYVQNPNRNYDQMGINHMGWWGPILGGIMVVGMVAAMVIGVNH